MASMGENDFEIFQKNSDTRDLGGPVDGEFLGNATKLVVMLLSFF